MIHRWSDPDLPRATLSPLGRTIDNSRVVRELDPRTSRDLWLLLGLALVLVSGAVLYAWPHVELRRQTQAIVRLAAERERLLEENRKLRLEKATLENLQRVETIARRDLGLSVPAPEHTVVVEQPPPPPSDTLIATRDAGGALRN